MRQIYNRIAFKPIRLKDLTLDEIKQVMKSLIFLTKKRNKVIKVRTYANGSTQQDYILKEETASPTVVIDSVLITSTIKVKQERDVIILDAPNAFMQTKILEGGKKTNYQIQRKNY